MNPRRYALIVAIIFSVIAILQVARAVVGWPIAVATPWGRSKDASLPVDIVLAPGARAHESFEQSRRASGIAAFVLYPRDATLLTRDALSAFGGAPPGREQARWFRASFHGIGMKAFWPLVTRSARRRTGAALASARSVVNLHIAKCHRGAHPGRDRLGLPRLLAERFLGSNDKHDLNLRRGSGRMIEDTAKWRARVNSPCPEPSNDSRLQACRVQSLSPWNPPMAKDRKQEQEANGLGAVEAALTHGGKLYDKPEDFDTALDHVAGLA